MSKNKVVEQEKEIDSLNEFFAGNIPWEATYDSAAITLTNKSGDVIIIDIDNQTIIKSSKIEPGLTFDEFSMVSDVLFENEVI